MNETNLELATKTILFLFLRSILKKREPVIFSQLDIFFYKNKKDGRSPSVDLTPRKNV